MNDNSEILSAKHEMFRIPDLEIRICISKRSDPEKTRVRSETAGTEGDSIHISFGLSP
jgi:hypothetical protein